MVAESESITCYLQTNWFSQDCTFRSSLELWTHCLKRRPTVVLINISRSQPSLFSASLLLYDHFSLRQYINECWLMYLYSILASTLTVPSTLLLRTQEPHILLMTISASLGVRRHWQRTPCMLWLPWSLISSWCALRFSTFHPYWRTHRSSDALSYGGTSILWSSSHPFYILEI